MISNQTRKKPTKYALTRSNVAGFYNEITSATIVGSNSTIFDQGILLSTTNTVLDPRSNNTDVSIGAINFELNNTENDVFGAGETANYSVMTLVVEEISSNFVGAELVVGLTNRNTDDLTGISVDEDVVLEKSVTLPPRTFVGQAINIDVSEMMTHAQGKGLTDATFTLRLNFLTQPGQTTPFIKFYDENNITNIKTPGKISNSDVVTTRPFDATLVKSGDSIQIIPDNNIQNANEVLLADVGLSGDVTLDVEDFSFGGNVISVPSTVSLEKGLGEYGMLAPIPNLVDGRYSVRVRSATTKVNNKKSITINDHDHQFRSNGIIRIKYQGATGPNENLEVVRYNFTQNKTGTKFTFPQTEITLTDETRFTPNQNYDIEDASLNPRLTVFKKSKV